MLFIRKGSGLSTYGIVRKDNIDQWAYYMLELPNELIWKLKLQGVVLEAGHYLVATSPTVWKNAVSSSEIFEAPMGAKFANLLKQSTSNTIIINNISDVEALMECGRYSVKLRDELGENSFRIIYNVDLMTSETLLDEVYFQYFDKHSSVFTFALGNNVAKSAIVDMNLVHNLDVIQWVGATFPTLIGVNAGVKFKMMQERYLVSEDCLFKLASDD